VSDEIISIVGGGWSVSQVDLSQIPGTIIAINDSAIHLPRFDIVVSMDRKWTEYRWPELRKLQKPARIRTAALKNIVGKWPWLASFDCDYTSAVFTDQPGVLNGTNSGLCGFNLAWQMRPAKILLFGFDMKRGPSGEAYWYPPYPWSEKGATTSGKYAAWSKQFSRAARQCKTAGIEVAVVGDSAIDVFPRIPSSEFARPSEKEFAA
jgi:hypothetical protein